MNIIAFLSGLILGLISLQMNKIMVLIRIILSGFTSFIFLKLHYQNLILWSISDYFIDENYVQLFKSPFLLTAIIYIFFSYFFFYFILYKFLQNGINKKGQMFIKSFVKHKNLSSIRTLIIFFIKIVRKISKLSNNIFEIEYNNDKQFIKSSKELIRFVSLFISTITPILVSISIILNFYSGIIISFLLLILFYNNSKGVYLVIFYKKIINEVFTEYNLNLDDEFNRDKQ